MLEEFLLKSGLVIKVTPVVKVHFINEILIILLICFCVFVKFKWKPVFSILHLEFSLLQSKCDSQL